MTNLFETDPVHPSELHAGSVIYYADAHTYSNQYLHGLQVAKVMVSNEKSFILDNGKRFNPATGEEVTRGNQGYLYPYTATTKAMVQDAETKLFLVNEVLSIDFNALTTQQLSLIKDVARGAFTQVTAPSPCGGECGNCQDTVEVASLDIELAQRQPEVTATIAFNDATYELSDSELDDIEDADDEDDEYDDTEQD
jgi:hypothetical protein